MNLPLPSPCELAETIRQERDHASRLVAALNPHCVVCGHQNPHGLQLSFCVDGSCIAAEWVPQTDWESFQGVIHGGVISTVLDEAMSKAIIVKGLEAFTAELRVRFKRKLHTGEVVQIRGWVIQQQKRRITAEASICNSAGDEHAHAWGVFLTVPPAHGNGVEITVANPVV